MWYEAGWLGQLAYATSTDGLHWDRPDLKIVPGTNLILPGFRPDSTTVFPDPHTDDPAQRFKLFLRPPEGPIGTVTPGYSMVSADGTHWSKPVESLCPGDRSTIFYNPFRRKWIYSLRTLEAGRTRRYREHENFLEGAGWSAEEPVFWESADEQDSPAPELGIEPQLYNLDAFAYKILMLRMFQIHRGPSNEECLRAGTPKITDPTVAFSRDGFHWHRSDRTPFLAGTAQPGSWERGYVQSVGVSVLFEMTNFGFIILALREMRPSAIPIGKKTGCMRAAARAWPSCAAMDLPQWTPTRKAANCLPVR
jgi:hypothetical protein